jgi:hypothetical protein
MRRLDAIGLLCGLVTLAMRGSLVRPRTWTRCQGEAAYAVDGRAAAAPV